MIIWSCASLANIFLPFKNWFVFETWADDVSFCPPDVADHAELMTLNSCTLIDVNLLFSAIETLLWERAAHKLRLDAFTVVPQYQMKC